MKRNELPISRNDPHEIFGWIVYDWANSAFYTTVVAALASSSTIRFCPTSRPKIDAIACRAVDTPGVTWVAASCSRLISSLFSQPQESGSQPEWQCDSRCCRPAFGGVAFRLLLLNN